MQKTALLLLLPLALGACSLAFGGRPETCGEYPPGGGPAVIRTRDQELCEIVRLRVQRALDGARGLPREEIDRLIDRTLGWEHQPTVDRLVAAIRIDAGDGMADDVRRAVDSVTERSARPLPAGCDDVERCLVKGAVLGARIALLYAQPTEARSAPPDGAPK